MFTKKSSTKSSLKFDAMAIMDFNQGKGYQSNPIVILILQVECTMMEMSGENKNMLKTTYLLDVDKYRFGL